MDMWYVGSKNKIAKDLVPIIQSYITADTKGYLEPFVGGANVIDKINCSNKIGCDIHKELIALLQKAQNQPNDIPNIITEEEYTAVKNNKPNYEDWYVGLVGFCATFGAKYFGGYARSKADKYKGEKTAMAIKNLKKQAPNLKGIKFVNCSFLDLPKDEIKGYVIYCDIPYKGTTKYATAGFPYDEFYEWANEMARYNTVLISEYDMPSVYRCIWEKDTKVNFDSNRTAGDEGNMRTEKLFLCNAETGYIYE